MDISETDLFAFCNECYSEFVPNGCTKFDDPIEGCSHAHPRLFYAKLQETFPQDVSPDTRLGILLAHLDAGRAIPDPVFCDTLSERTLYGFFCSFVWYTQTPQIPRTPPPSVPGSWTLHNCNARAHHYSLLAAIYPSSLPDLVRGFMELHRVTPSEGLFQDRALPLARQWLPCYAPAFFCSSYTGNTPYQCVPVHPHLNTLGHFTSYVDSQDTVMGPRERLSGEAMEELRVRALGESRAAMSDVELGRRINDLEVFGSSLCGMMPPTAQDESFFLNSDVSLLLDRHRLELKLRIEHASSLVLASYLYSASRSYTSLTGASNREPRFGMRFFLAVQQAQKLYPAIVRNIPRPLSENMLLFRNRSTAVIDRLRGFATPDVLWAYFAGRPGDYCKHEQLLDEWFELYMKK